jgi:hypothetical protein
LERRLVGSVIIAVGALALLAGIVLMLGVAPRFRQLADDARWTERYEGRLRTNMDLQTMVSRGSNRLAVQRTIAVQDTSGGSALVRDELVTRTPQGRLSRSVTHYALDRATMAGTDEHPPEWNETANYWTRRGLVCGWPFDVNAGDYWGWVDPYRRAVPVRFVGEVVHADTGLTAYRYASSGMPQPVAQEEVAFLGLPTTISKELLLTVMDTSQANPVLRRLLPDVLAAWPGPGMPIAYSWEFHTQYWIEPRTGVVLDLRTRQILRVGLAEEVIVATPLATLPAVQRNALQFTVQEMDYESTEGTIAQAERTVDDRLWPLNLYGTILPIALVVGGLAVGTVGSLLVSWRRYGV